MAVSALCTLVEDCGLELLTNVGQDQIANVSPLVYGMYLNSKKLSQCRFLKRKRYSKNKLIIQYCMVPDPLNPYTTIIWALPRENLSSGFPPKRVSSQSLQLQTLARKLKFHL